MSLRPGNKNQRRTEQPSREFLEVLKYEMALTAETMAQELTELQIMGYVETLTGMTIEQIRAGFKRARKTLRWFPKPVEVRELAITEIEESAPKQYYLPEPEPVWTDEERQEWLEEIRIACGVKPKYKPPTDQEIEQRRQFLLRQKDQILNPGKQE